MNLKNRFNTVKRNLKQGIIKRSIRLFVFSFVFSTTFAFTQDAVIHSVPFDVSPSLRKDIQKRDAAGELEWKYVNGRKMPDTYKEDLTRMQAETICNVIADTLKSKYGYKEVEIAFSGGLGSLKPSRLYEFPHKSLKSSIKDYDSGVYADVQVNISGRKGGGAIIMGRKKEEYVRFTSSITLTLYDSSMRPIETKTIEVDDFSDLFDAKYSVSQEKEQFRISGKGHLTTKDIGDIFKYTWQELFTE
jgi:hypothetical protein